MTDSQPRIMVNDDGWIMGAYGPPLTPDILREKMIDPYEDSPVDVFLWSVGGHDVYDFETDVGERFGYGYSDEALGGQMCERRDNLRFLCDNHGGPVTVISQLCREAGMRFFPSVRMNEHYDIDEMAPNYGQLRRTKPHLLIGLPGEAIPKGTLEWGIRTGLNYAVPDVREYMLKIIFELVEEFEIDGIELDFMRHPAFFRVEEAFAQRHLITEMVRLVRAKLDTVGSIRHSHIDLAVRVPPTLTDSRRIGLDAEEWVREGLVDILIAGGGFIPFEMPIASFVGLANESSSRVFGCFEGLRPLLDKEALRAVATRYWAHGVDGLYFFNYYSMPSDWKKNFLSELVDPSAMVEKNKQYQIDSSGRSEPTSQLGFSFSNAIPKAQLPVCLRETPSGCGLVLFIDLSDDIKVNSPDRCILGFNFESMINEQLLSLSFNGCPIDWQADQQNPHLWSTTQYNADWDKYPSRVKETLGDDGWQVEFKIFPSALEAGVNELELTMQKGNPIWLLGVRLWLQYGDDD